MIAQKNSTQEQVRRLDRFSILSYAAKKVIQFNFGLENSWDVPIDPNAKIEIMMRKYMKSTI